MTRVAFTFVSREPAGNLVGYVRSIWFAKGRIAHQRERIAPTGSTVGAIVLGAPITQIPNDGQAEPFDAVTGFLIGPHDRPIVNEPSAETHCVGIVTAPAACRAVFGLDPAPLRGRIVDLLAAWPAGVPLRRRLMAMSDNGSEPDAMLDAVEAALRDGIDGADPGLDRCAMAVAALEHDPGRSIAELAASLGLSHGHLDREFTRYVGLSPRALARSLRVGALLERIDVSAPVMWSEHATALGWYDQAHLIRDFKKHTGVTPTEYQQAQRRLFEPDEQLPGFVPDATM